MDSVFYVSEKVEIIAARATSPGKAVSSPSVLRLPSGRILLSYDEYSSDRSKKKSALTVIKASEDNGLSWTTISVLALTQARLLSINRDVYCVGNYGDIAISRSINEGSSWSSVAKLTSDQIWHQTAANVWFTENQIYLSMERVTASFPETWPVCWLAPVLLRARIGSDLLLKESWTLSAEISLCELLPGLSQNRTPGEYFGIPFHNQQYPNANDLGHGRLMHPIGWLEGNVIQILDPQSYWFDPSLRVFHIFMRCNTGGTGYAALLKIIEHPDGSMTPAFETVPSGKRILFLPMPGGHLRFHILYDVESRLYWLLSSQPTDSMRRIEYLPSSRPNLANNERHRMVLHFSRNMVDWCFAGVVAQSNSESLTRNYGSMNFDGADLIIAARSADVEAASVRDTNIITFHRVRNFRRLVY